MLRGRTKRRTKVDGDGHAALVRSPAVLASGRRGDRVGHGRCEGRGRRRMPLWCVDRAGLVQRRRCPHVGIHTARKREVERRVGRSHLHGQHALVDALDAPGRRRRRPVAPLRARSAMNHGVAGLKARWRWRRAAGRQQGGFLINLRCRLRRGLLLNGASVERLRAVGILVVPASRLAAAAHGELRRSGERGNSDEHWNWGKTQRVHHAPWGGRLWDQNGSASTALDSGARGR